MAPSSLIFNQNVNPVAQITKFDNGGNQFYGEVGEVFPHSFDYTLVRATVAFQLTPFSLPGDPVQPAINSTLNVYAWNGGTAPGDLLGSFSSTNSYNGSDTWVTWSFDLGVRVTQDILVTVSPDQPPPVYVPQWGRWVNRSIGPGTAGLPASNTYLYYTYNNQWYPWQFTDTAPVSGRLAINLYQFGAQVIPDPNNLTWLLCGLPLLRPHRTADRRKIDGLESP